MQGSGNAPQKRNAGTHGPNLQQKNGEESGEQAGREKSADGGHECGWLVGSVRFKTKSGAVGEPIAAPGHRVC